MSTDSIAGQGSSSPSIVAGSVALLVVTALVGVVLVVAGVVTAGQALVIAGTILIAISALIPLWVASFRRANIISLVLPIFIAYNVVSTAVAQTNTAIIQIALIVGGGAMFCFGAVLAGRKSPPLDAEIQPIVVRERWIYSLLAVGGLASLYSFATNGIPVLSSNIAEERLSAFANGYLGTLIVTTLQPVVIVGLCRALDSVSASNRLRAVIPSALGLLALYGFGNRGLYFVPILVVLAYAIIRKPARVIPVSLVGVVGLISISVAGYVRDLQAFGPSYNRDLQLMGVSPDLIFLGPLVSYFRGTSVAVDLIIQTFPSKVAYPMGSVFFSPLLSPLPGQQPSAGQFLKQALGLQFTGFGLAPGTIGGFYMDFGPIGVLVGMFVLGMLGRISYERALVSRRAVLVYSFLVAQFWFMNYAHPFPYLAVLSVPITLWLISRPDFGTPISAPAVTNEWNSRRGVRGSIWGYFRSAL